MRLCCCDRNDSFIKHAVAHQYFFQLGHQLLKLLCGSVTRVLYFSKNVHIYLAIMKEDVKIRSAARVGLSCNFMVFQLEYLPERCTEYIKWSPLFSRMKSVGKSV